MVLIKNIGEIDAKILWELLNDARKDFSKIAEECGITRNAVWKHYNLMKKAGIIVGTILQINYEHFGYEAIALMIFHTKSDETGQIRENIQKIPNVIGIFSLELQSYLMVFATLRKLSELSKLKVQIEQESSAEDFRTHVWTSIKNIPENLSFGLPAKTTEAYKKKPQSTIESIDTKRKIDETDLLIINQLIQNGRKSFRKIAKEIGVTTDTVARRFRKLKRNSTIKTIIQIKPSKIGYCALLECNLAFKSQRDSLRAMDTLAKLPDVYWIVATSGVYDLHVWVLIRDIKHLLTVHDEIRELPGTSKMEIHLGRLFPDMYPNPYINTFKQCNDKPHLPLI